MDFFRARRYLPFQDIYHLLQNPREHSSFLEEEEIIIEIKILIPEIEGNNDPIIVVARIEEF